MAEMKFYEAGVAVLQQAVVPLRMHVNAYHAGKFFGIHEEIGEIEDLISQYERLEREGFMELDECAAWLHKVADMLPNLWD